MNAWPKDDRASLEAFYGTHELDLAGKPTAHWEESNLAFLAPPWKMVLSWDPTKRVRVIKCHWSVRDSLARILDTIWQHYGSQAAIEAVGLHLWGGCYEFRRVSGSNELSTHAWGAGVDINPASNPRGKPWKDKTGMMPLFVIAAFKAEGWDWGGHFRTPDAMHFQATRSAAATVAPAAAGLVAGSAPTMTATTLPEPSVSMREALAVPPFPETGDTVNWEGSHVYGTVAGQMRQFGYQFGQPAPATPGPRSFLDLMRREYPASLADGLRQWVVSYAAENGEPDPAKARSWWIRKGLGDPEREVARRMNWMVFEALGGE
jgi:hypothetical protein